MPSDAVTLDRLAAEIPDLAPRIVGAPASVNDVQHDSRRVAPGAAFVALRGTTTDGHLHVSEAVRAGATAVVVDHAVEGAPSQLVVADTRRALAPLAAAVHGHPADALTLLGVTGTNGKTTVTFMLEAIASASGRAAGVVGTIGARIAGRPVTIAHTTPEASDLQRLLGLMRDAGVEVAALEVSSHALAYGRVDAMRFDAVGFTNLSQDHLDFHGDMESYYAAKRSLFTKERADRAVIWVDDPAGRRLADETDLDVVTVGFGKADVTGTILASGVSGSEIRVRRGGAEFELHVPLPGRFNVANGLVAAAMALETGASPEDVARGLAALGPVRGRFETVDTGQPFTVAIDYAHTPDAIANVIAEAGQVASGRVIAVFGAAGDRDRAKRPLMGAAGATADVAILTSDNPRSEDPEQIISEVRAGVPRGAKLIVEPDRAAAIARAIGEAEPGDIVLVLGKGHEQGQERAGEMVPFDDRAVVLGVLSEGGGGPE